MESISSEIKAVKLIHIALFIGQLIFAVIAFAVVFFQTMIPTLSYRSTQLSILAVVIAVGCYLTSEFIFKKKLLQVNKTGGSIQLKLNNYRAAGIIRWAILEFSILFSLILFLLTHNYFILLMVALLLFLFYNLKPTISRIANDLQISVMELEQP